MDLTSACCSVIFTWLLSAASSVQENIIAVSKQKTILTCLVANNNTYTAVKWKKDGLGEEYVLLYRNGHFEPENQHPSFRNRVSLQETLMKDGDVSLILNDVSSADSGTYECRVYMKGTRSWKSISNITLSVVDPPGQTGGHTEDGSVGLKVGLPVGLIVAAAAVGGVFLIYRKLKAQSQGSYQPPAEQQPV